MAKLKRDERICPYCAETIKASAIRCRFCQSDVTPVIEPEAQPTIEAKPKPKPVTRAVPKPAAVESEGTEDTEGTEGDSEDTAAPSRTPLLQRLTLVLAVLVALAGAGVGTLWWSADHGTATAAPNGTLVADDARTEVLISAADLAQRTLSYDYRTLANDMETARARMTPAFRKQYDATMAQVRANTTKNKIVLQAVAVSSAIITATEHKAKVLVFLNQTTTAGVGKSAKQQANQNSLVVTLTRGDGDWAISKLTALG